MLGHVSCFLTDHDTCSRHLRVTQASFSRHTKYSSACNSPSRIIATQHYLHFGIWIYATISREKCSLIFSEEGVTHVILLLEYAGWGDPILPIRWRYFLKYPRTVVEVDLYVATSCSRDEVPDKMVDRTLSHMRCQLRSVCPDNSRFVGFKPSRSTCQAQESTLASFRRWCVCLIL